jgi:glycerol-3-phosphate dehydrogenase
MAPGCVRPLPFVVGTYRSGARTRARIALGLRVYDAIGFDRNKGLPAALHLPASQVIGPDEVEARLPGINREGLTGAGVWCDYQVTHPDRLNWLVARAAIEAGAVLANYAEAIGPLREQSRITGAVVRDVVSGAEINVSARMTLVCAGSGLRAVLSAYGLDDEVPPLLAAANLLLRQTPPPCALAAPGLSGRMLTMVPWAGRTLVGTFQSPSTVTPGDTFPLGVTAMLADANAAFPMLRATPGDVLLVHRGLTPAVVSREGADLLAEPRIIRHSARGIEGILSLVGVKFTTARLAAKVALRAVSAALGLPFDADLHTARLLPDADPVSVQDAFSGLDSPAPDVAAHLVDWYGPEARRVWALALTRGLTSPLDGSAVIEAEIVAAVEDARAVRLADVVLRRTRLGGAGHPGNRALHQAADVMAHALGWSEHERAREVDAVLDRYRV